MLALSASNISDEIVALSSKSKKPSLKISVPPSIMSFSAFSFSVPEIVMLSPTFRVPPPVPFNSIVCSANTSKASVSVNLLSSAISMLDELYGKKVSMVPSWSTSTYPSVKLSETYTFSTFPIPSNFKILSALRVKLSEL